MHFGKGMERSQNPQQMLHIWNICHYIWLEFMHQMLHIWNICRYIWLEFMHHMLHIWNICRYIWLELMINKCMYMSIPAQRGACRPTIPKRSKVQVSSAQRVSAAPRSNEPPLSTRIVMGPPLTVRVPSLCLCHIVFDM